MPGNIFIVTTTEDEGKAKQLSKINSHCALQKHAKARGKTTVCSAQPDKDGLLPHARKRAYQYALTNNTAGFQNPWLIANRPDRALYSELVPVIRWPVKFTSYEKSLVHFLLDEGRRFSFSEGMNPSYSLAFDLAHRYLESTQMFPICHAVMAESFMLQIHGRKPTKVFYARQAHAYRLMNEMLNDRSVACDAKLLAFGQVTAMDLILGKPEMNRQHFHALDEYIELLGGLGHVLAIPRDPHSVLDPWRFVLYFCWAELPVRIHSRLVALIERFMSYLRRIRQWALAIVSKEQFEVKDVSSFETGYAVATVHDYVLWLYHDCWEGAHKHYGANTASLCFIFILCLAQAEYSYDTAETLQLFELLAPRVARSKNKDPICVLPRLHPISAISSMAYIRDRIMYNKPKELILCEANVDAMRVAPLLSPTTMRRLIQTCINCAFQPVGSTLSQSDMEFLSEESLRVVKEEIWLAWISASRAETKLKTCPQDTVRQCQDDCG